MPPDSDTRLGAYEVVSPGGTPAAVTKVDGGDHRFPSFLADGRHVLVVVNWAAALQK